MKKILFGIFIGLFSISASFAAVVSRGAVATGCGCGYKLVNGDCQPKTNKDKKCTKNTKPALPENAKSATMGCFNGVEYCFVDECESENVAFIKNANRTECIKKDCKAGYISGVVFDQDGNTLEGVELYVNGGRITNTGSMGAFEVSNVPGCYVKVEFRMVGCVSKIVTADKLYLGRVDMDCTPVQIEEVVITGGLCDPDTDNGVKVARIQSGGKCVPEECLKPRWALSGTGKYAECVEQACSITNGTGKWVEDKQISYTPDKNKVANPQTYTAMTHKCVVASCDYGFEANENETKCKPKTGNCTADYKGENVHLVKLAEWDNGVCRVKTCETGHQPNKTDNICVPITDCPTKLLTQYNAKSGKYKYEGGQESCYDLVCKSDKYQFYGAPHNKCLQKCDITTADRRKGIASKAMSDDGVCYPTGCNAPQYKLNGTAGTKGATCVEQDCKFDNGTGEWNQGTDGEWECKLKSCDTKKGFVPNSDNTACVSSKCSCGQVFDDTTKVCRDKTDVEKKCGDNLENVKDAELRCNDRGVEYCHVVACVDKDAFKIIDNKSCKSVVGDKCTPVAPIDNAKTYKMYVDYENSKYTVRCGVDKCDNDYEADTDGTGCNQVKGSCTPEHTDGVDKASMQNGKCIITKCDEPEYKLNTTENKCEKIEGAPCTDEKILKSIHALSGKRTVKDGRATCYPETCESERYELQNKNDPALATCRDTNGDVCTEKFKDDDGNNNVYLAKYKVGDKGFDCYVEQCKTGFKQVDNACVTKNGDPCDGDLLKKYTGATGGTYRYENGQEKCVDLTCDDKKGYKPNDSKTDCVEKLKECTDTQKNEIDYATAWGIKPGTEDCVALACDCGYKVQNGKCEPKTEQDKVCTKTSTPRLPENAVTAHMVCRNSAEVCVVDTCESEQYVKANGDTECRDRVGESCNPNSETDKLPDNSPIKEALYEYGAGGLRCVVKSCKSKDYDVIDNDCVQVRGACTSDDPHAAEINGTKRGTYKKVDKKPACVPDACMAGYRVKDGVCKPHKCPCGYYEDGGECKKREDSTKCYPESTPSAPAHANYGYYSCPDGEQGAEKCLLLKEKEDANNKYCQDGYEPDYDSSRCLSIDGKDCMSEITKQIAGPNGGEDVLNLGKVTSASWDVAKNGAIVCRVTGCVENYDPNADKNGCKRVSGPCTSEELNGAHKFAEAGEWKDGKCFVTECKDGWKPNKAGGCTADPCGCLKKMDEESGECEDMTGDELACNHNTVPALHKYGATGTMKCNSRGKAYCMVETCKDGYKKNDDNTKCVSEKNDKCEAKDTNGNEKEHVATARMRERNGALECVITDCTDGYMVDKVNNICIQRDGDCTDEQVKKLDDKATAGQLSKGKCVVITKCKDGFEPDDKGKQCVEIGGPCDKMPERAKVAHRRYDLNTNITQCIIEQCEPEYAPSKDGLRCVSAPTLTREQAQKRVDEAQAKYDAARENEQSLKNRMLAATTMGAMGVGGKMLAQSLAEQSADADAERDMAAYLASFRCDYGAGRNIKGGEMNVELPGGSALIPLYSEYVALANDLKSRKAQLGLKSGVESEPILDSATTGLYDDVSTGITSGTYASLARAMLNPGGEDAKMWAEQKEKTQQNLTAGAAAVGIEAVVGIAGNIAHTNAHKDKLKQIDIKDELDSLGKAVDKLPSQEATKCPFGASGSVPYCDCGNNYEYNPNTRRCDKCPGNQTAQDGKCGCWNVALPNWDAQGQKCVAAPTNCTPECDTPTIGNKLVVDSTCRCSCVKGYAYVGKRCIPNSLEKYDLKVPGLDEVIRQGMTVGQGNAQSTTIEAGIIGAPLPGFSLSGLVQPMIIADMPSVTLGAHNLFNTGSSDLTSAAKGEIEKFVKKLKDKENISSCEFYVFGYTDKSGSSQTNQALSEQRANAVGNHLETLLEKAAIEFKIETDGFGEDLCLCEEKDLTGACDGLKDGDEPADGSHYKPCRKVEISVRCYAKENDKKTAALTQLDETSDNINHNANAGGGGEFGGADLGGGWTERVKRMDGAPSNCIPGQEGKVQWELYLNTDRLNEIEMDRALKAKQEECVKHTKGIWKENSLNHAEAFGKLKVFADNFYSCVCPEQMD